MEPGDKLSAAAQQYWADPDQAILNDMARAARSLDRIADRLKEPCRTTNGMQVTLPNHKGGGEQISVDSNKLLGWMRNKTHALKALSKDSALRPSAVVHVNGFADLASSDHQLKRIASPELQEAFEGLRDLTGSIIERIDEQRGDNKFTVQAEEFSVNASSKSSKEGPKIFNHFNNPTNHIHLKGTLTAALKAERTLEEPMPEATEWQRRFTEKELSNNFTSRNPRKSPVAIEGLVEEVVASKNQLQPTTGKPYVEGPKGQKLQSEFEFSYLNKPGSKTEPRQPLPRESQEKSTTLGK